MPFSKAFNQDSTFWYKVQTQPGFQHALQTRILPFSFISQTAITSFLLARFLKKIIYISKIYHFLIVCQYFLSQQECLSPIHISTPVILQFYSAVTSITKLFPLSQKAVSPYPYEIIQQSF